MNILFFSAASSLMLLFASKAGLANTENDLTLEVPYSSDQHQDISERGQGEFGSRFDFIAQAEVPVDSSEVEPFANAPDQELVEIERTQGFGEVKTGESPVVAVSGLLCSAEYNLPSCAIPGLLELARGIIDGVSRIRILVEVAYIQSEVGDLAGARSTISEALEAVKSINDAYLRCGALTLVSDAQVSAGDLEGAHSSLLAANEVALSISDDSRSYCLIDIDYAFSIIAGAQIDSGDIAGALKTAESIVASSDPASWVRVRVAYAYAEAGDAEMVESSVSEARRIADHAPDDFYRHRALLYVADAQTAAGDLAGATLLLSTIQDTALLISDEYTRSDVLSLVATAQLKAGDVLGALKSAENMSIEPMRDQVFVEVARAQSGLGDTVAARRTADLIKDEDHRSQSLYYVVDAQVSAGNVAGAEKTTEDITDLVALSRALARIASVPRLT